MENYPRRRFLGLLAALSGSMWRMNAEDLPDTPPRAPASGPGNKKQTRQYRADATVLLWGMPIFHRSGVGGGQASLEEWSEGESTMRKLFFAAGSDAARAHGVNRVGWIREVVREANSVPIEAQYFGVLTASNNEESLEHARQAASAPATGPSRFSAVSGKNTPGDSRSAVAHFELSGGAGWSDRRLIDAAQAAFHDKAEWRQTSWPKAGQQTPPTFLFELARLLRQRTPHAVGRYVYNEQEYRLELNAPQPGKKESTDAGLVPVHGKIRNLRSGTQSTFTLWLDESSDSIVPMRIEYQPRSFLRLVFEAA